jgi:hypothetical protein
MPFAFQSSCSGQTSRVASPCSNRRTLSWGTDVLSWTPGKAHASKRRRTSATSSKLDVRGRLRCACNAASSAPPSEAATESPIPSRPPDARELFPTRVSVAPSGLSPPPALSTFCGGSRCGVRVRRASCGASPMAPGASATPRSLPRSWTRAWDKFRSVSWVSPAAQTPLETQIKSRALQTAS